jgi:hypothetical protein
MAEEYPEYDPADLTIHLGEALHGKGARRLDFVRGARKT